MKKVKLSLIVDQFELINDLIRFYLKRTTGEIVMISEFDSFEEEEALKEEVSSSDDYVGLPSKWDIHEYSIMEDFCYTIKDLNLQERLLVSIRGRGAFRHFKDKIFEEGIEQEWFDFRNESFERIARDWLEANEIPFSEE